MSSTLEQAGWRHLHLCGLTVIYKNEVHSRVYQKQAWLLARWLWVHTRHHFTSWLCEPGGHSHLIPSFFPHKVGVPIQGSRGGRVTWGMYHVALHCKLKSWSWGGGSLQVILGSYKVRWSRVRAAGKD